MQNTEKPGQYGVRVPENREIFKSKVIKVPIRPVITHPILSDNSNM